MTISRIAVAYDGCPSSDLVIRYACWLGQALEAGLHFVHVLDDATLERVGTARGLSGPDLEKHCRTRKRRIFERIERTCRGENWLDRNGWQKALVRAPSVVNGVTEHASEQDAELLLVQPSPHEEDVRLRIARRIWLMAPVPVLLVQADRQKGDGQGESSLLIPVDDDPLTLRTVCYGTGLAVAAGLGVVLCYVQTNNEDWAGGDSHQVLAKAEQIVAQSSVACQTVVTQGSAPDLALIRVAIEHRVRMVLMRRSHRTLLGSTASLLIANSYQNILLVDDTHCAPCGDCPIGCLAGDGG